MEESGIKLRTSYSDTMLNYRLSQKLKLLEYGKFNHLTNTSNNDYYPFHFLLIAYIILILF